MPLGATVVAASRTFTLRVRSRAWVPGGAAAWAARDTEEALRAECERLMQDKEATAREMAEFCEWEEITAPWPD